MARRVNFNYEKRQKELRKAKKKAEKAEAKRARREGGADAPAPAEDEYIDPFDAIPEAQGSDTPPETP